MAQGATAGSSSVYSRISGVTGSPGSTARASFSAISSAPISPASARFAGGQAAHQ